MYNISISILCYKSLQFIFYLSDVWNAYECVVFGLYLYFVLLHTYILFADEWLHEILIRFGVRWATIGLPSMLLSPRHSMREYLCAFLFECAPYKFMYSRRRRIGSEICMWHPLIAIIMPRNANGCGEIKMNFDGIRIHIHVTSFFFIRRSKQRRCWNETLKWSYFFGWSSVIQSWRINCVTSVCAFTCENEDILWAFPGCWWWGLLSIPTHLSRSMRLFIVNPWFGRKYHSKWKMTYESLIFCSEILVFVEHHFLQC